MTNLTRNYLSTKTLAELDEIGSIAEHLRDISKPKSPNWYLALHYIFELITLYSIMENLVDQANSLINKK